MPDNMNAAVLHGAGDLRYQKAEMPSKGADDVLIRVRMNGICGSDIHFFEDGRLGPYVVSRPYIPGHEACGTVVEEADSGSHNSQAPRKGQRVAIEPGIPCRQCELCKSGRYNLCKNVRFLSAPPENGSFAEYVSIPWDFAHVLPDSVDDECGAFVEPISVGIQACERAGLSAGSSVAIVGAGPIGLTLALVARSYGAAVVYLVDVLDSRLDFGKAMGADEVFNATREDVAQAVAAASGGGVDVVFDTSGSSVAAAGTPDLATRGGVIVLVGWPETASFPFPIELVLEKELDVRGVNRYCNTYKKAISLLAAGHLNPKPLVSHRYSFSDVVSAFEFARDNKVKTMKVMVANN
jgi:L-iditol 2-dehydrogenase